MTAKSKEEGRWGLGGGQSASWEWCPSAVTLGCFRPGFGLRRSSSHPRGRKAAGASLNAGRAGGQWGCAASGLGCVRSRGSASAAARDGGGQVRRQTVCVERSCRVAWPRAAGKGRAQDSLQVQLGLRRRSAQCGSGSLHLQEKKRKKYI